MGEMTDFSSKKLENLKIQKVQCLVYLGVVLRLCNAAPGFESPLASHQLWTLGLLTSPCPHFFMCKMHIVRVSLASYMNP